VTLPPPGPFAREQSSAEERANSISHGVALALAIAAAPFAIVGAVRRGDVAFITGTAVFVATVLLLYLASTLYHAAPHGRGKRVLRVFDHAAIFLLIAGTYTPFTLGVLRGALGWGLFGTVWGLALGGVALKACGRAHGPVVSSALYLSMGWLVVVALDRVFTLVPSAGLAWLLAGGACYTVGVAFFVADSRLRFGHFVWHLFVVAGTTCHYFAVLWYAAAPAAAGS